ncbi:MAG: hypothetical protein H6Q76_357 [Firmicutes bacterium]|nr:hypothetical protein [Bacillota bacterium]
MVKMHSTGWNKLVSILIGSLCFFYAVMGLCEPAALSERGTTVESVRVEVVADPLPSGRVLRRMSESVKTIGEHLLVGRTTIEVSEHREHYEKLIRDVFDRVLSGYTVEQVTIEPTSETTIRIHIVPWGDSVQKVDILVDYSGIEQEALPLVKRDMGKMEEDIRGALLGLPVDAVDWASGVARELIRELLRRQLPEFHFSLDVEAGRQTKVRLSLFPTGQLVKEAQVSLRSNTIPNMLLIHARPAVELQARSMRGLPVEYVERNIKYFADKVRQVTLEDPVIKQFGLKVTPVVRPGSDTEVAVSVEAETYRITAEVQLDIGRDKDNIAGEAHIGRRLGHYDELFLELKVLPGDMTWQIMPGWGHQFGSDTWVGLRYRTNDQELGWRLNQGLGGRWSLRAERWPRIDSNEVGIRYKLHDFLSAEFVFTNNRNWLRLVGHL